MGKALPDSDIFWPCLIKRINPTPRRLSILLGTVLLIAAAGCSTPPTNGVSISSIQSAASSGPGVHSSATLGNDKPVSKQERGVIGVWRGTTLASCSNLFTPPNRCNAEQKVSFTLIQKNGQLLGYYTCAYGNMICRKVNDKGKIIRASVNGARLNIRVQLPDGSTCRYTGMRSNANINGGYSCLQGSTVVEQGTWRAKHQY
ncbi:MAG: hypothetical protein ACREQ4_11505 [Candidatus Binataceae bacterium]